MLVWILWDTNCEYDEVNLELIYCQNNVLINIITGYIMATLLQTFLLPGATHLWSGVLSTYITMSWFCLLSVSTVKAN